MKFEDCFKEENLELLFDCINHKNEFIACADDLYSEYDSCDIYSTEWAWQFPAGRYVIIVYQRYAVFQNGVEMYVNEHFKNVVSGYCRSKKVRYCLITKDLNEYYITSWKRNLATHSIQEEKEPLQKKSFLSIEEARDAAIKYSEGGNTVAIVSWYADFDMY